MVLVGLLVLVAGLCLAPMAETDLFFRLRVGEEILRSHAVPRRNLFSFTHPDHPDLDPAWLFDVAVAGLHRAGGLPAVIIAKTLVVLAAFAVMFLVCRKRGASTIASAVALAAAALVMRERLVERPHVFSLLGEAVVLLLLASPHRRRLWALVPVTVLWANLHAGAFLAAPLVALTALGEAIDTRTRDARPWLVAGGCALALVATPVGIGVVKYLAFHAGIFAVHPVDEFRSPTWISDAPVFVFALVTAALALLRPRPPWRVTLPVLALALLAAGSVRFAADFAFVAAPLLASALGARPACRRLDESRAAHALVAIALVAVAGAPRWAAARAGHPPFSLALDPSLLPLDAIAFANAHGLRERMYNDLDVGGYLMWEGYPRHRVFVDPRLPAYPLAFHRLLGQAALTRTAWDSALDRYDVTSALVAYAGINHRIGWWDPQRWALVYRQHDARIFVRRLPAWRAFIAAHEIPATFSFSPQSGATTALIESLPADSPVPACEWQRRVGELAFELDGPHSERALAAYRNALAAPAGCLTAKDEAEAAAWVGATLLEQRHFEEALSALDRALTHLPDDLPTLTNRALALESLGRRQEAAEAWTVVASRAGATSLGARATERAAGLSH